jgi:cell division protein FtsQ
MILTYSGFATKMIIVAGTETLTNDDIFKTAAIKNGDNIFKINIGEVRKKLLAHPWIKSVEIERELPSRLSIKIVEHKTAFALDAGGCFLVNKDGRVFTQCNFAEVTKPVVRGIPGEQMSVAGTASFKKSDLTVSVLDLLTLLEGSDHDLQLDAIMEITVDEKFGLDLVTRGDIERIKLGFGSYQKKIERISEICELFKKRAGIKKISMIDLFDINRIVVKPAQI